MGLGGCGVGFKGWVYHDSWSEIRNLGSLRPTSMVYREESDFEGFLKSDRKVKY